MSEQTTTVVETESTETSQQSPRAAKAVAAVALSAIAVGIVLAVKRNMKPAVEQEPETPLYVADVLAAE